MADKEIKEILSAYALGCMDKKNLDHFKEYLEIEGDLPYDLLSDYVKLSSLIPTILTIEKPDPKLKETVAKNLLSLQNEVKEKIKIKQTSASESKSEKEEQLLNIENQQEISEPEQKFETEIESKSLEESTNFNTLSTRTTLFSQGDYERGTRETEEFPNGENAASPFNLFNFIVAAIVIIILVLFGYYFHNTNNKIEEEVKVLSAKVDKLTNDLNYSKEFISKYEKMIDFFNYSDIIIINLSGTESTSKAIGRLFISEEGREALLEFKNLPILKNTEAYYLWIVSNQISYQLHSFVPKTGEKFILIPEFPRIPIEEVDLIIVTNEPRAGSETPQGTTHLFGSIKNGK